MKALEKAINTLNSLATTTYSTTVDPRIRLVVTFVYIGIVLSVPMTDPGRLVWLAAFPIFTAEMCGAGYGRVFLRSLWILPLAVLIGVFNPILDREPWWVIGGVAVSRGWVSFACVVLRGLLTFQALLVLVMSMGFYDVCRAIGSLGCPRILTTQLMMLYRYIGVLMQEALTMHRAREARGFGRRSYPLRMWGTFVGQLLIRSVQRSRRINAAMEARGFTGVYHLSKRFAAPKANSWIWLAVWLAVFAALRFVDLTAIFNNLITRTL